MFVEGTTVVVTAGTVSGVVANPALMAAAWASAGTAFKVVIGVGIAAGATGLGVVAVVGVAAAVAYKLAR